MSETKVVKDIMVKASADGDRLFRNNVGTGWQGKSTRLPTGDMLLKFPRPLNAGLCKGSSDLIGWSMVTITHSMVGKDLPIFTAAEIKYGKGKASKEQTAFVNYLKSINGIAGIFHNYEQFKEEKLLWLKKMCSM